MIDLGIISEDEMIGAFLQAEINGRHEIIKNIIMKKLEMYKQGRDIIDDPKYDIPEINKIRKEILAVRGYPNTHLFTNFPANMVWHRVLIGIKELKNIQYLSDKEGLLPLTGTRSPGAFAVKIKGDPKKPQHLPYLEAAEKIKRGNAFTEMILVARNADPGSNVVTLEGNLRITAYMLAFEYIKKEVKAIIGYSEDIKKWDCY